MKTNVSSLLRLGALLLSGAASLFATTVIAPEFDDLVGKADYVVRATVKSVTSEWRVSGGQRHIFTKVELTVNEVITGTPPNPLVLDLLGGVVGDEELRVEGTPKFKVGEEDVLFVQANGRQFYPLVGIMHGKYPVERDAKTGREYIARSNGAPLYNEKEVVEPMEAAVAGSAPAGQQPLSPAAFAAKIRETHAALQLRQRVQH
ncbi:MAG: hypothetical protein HY302_04710 [Opitutae bacterium]|nr:hypothetical protein [Opitutae bacterium]